MFGTKRQHSPQFGGIQIDDDKSIQIHKPRAEARGNLWAEGRLLFRDLAFALMLASGMVMFCNSAPFQWTETSFCVVRG